MTPSHLSMISHLFQIFDKALDEPRYSSMYAKLCHQLCREAPNFEPESSNISVSNLIHNWNQHTRLWFLSFMHSHLFMGESFQDYS